MVPRARLPPGRAARRLVRSKGRAIVLISSFSVIQAGGAAPI